MSSSQRMWIIAVVLVLVTAVLGSQVWADIPTKLNYQLRLTDLTGDPLPGAHTMVYSIYDAETGGNQLWSETKEEVADANGVISTILGSESPIGISFDDPYWLEVEVDGEVLLLRREIVSSAYTFQSANADNLGHLPPSSYSQVGHTHDDIYYTETELNTSDGDPPNQGANRVSWDVLADMPAGFADGVDDSGPGGTITGVTAGTGLTGGGTTGTVKVDVGAGTGIQVGGDQVAFDTSWGDGRYVNEGQANSIASAMIQPAAVVQSHVSNGYVDLSSIQTIGGKKYHRVSASSEAPLFVENQASNGTGIVAIGDNQGLSWFAQGAGGQFKGLSFGVVARATQSGSSGQCALWGLIDAQSPRLARVCYRATDGTQYKIQGDGIASTIVHTDLRGSVSLACPESPEAWIEDFGSSEIIAGFSHVDLDPVLLECITVSEAHPMRVFIQLTSALESPFYVQKGLTGFDVIVTGEGGESAEATYDYRVVAKWKGYENFRFASAEPPNLEE